MSEQFCNIFFTRRARLMFGIILLIFITILASSMIASFAAAPPISVNGWTPAKGTTVNTASPEVSLYVYSTAADLNVAVVRAKIDGNSVNATLTLKGHWEYDSCGQSYWIQDSKREGTVLLASRELEDGVHRAEVTVSDMIGNSTTEEWSFTVGVPPKFSSLQPAENSQVGSVTKISAVVTDPVGVDWNSIILKLDGNVVQHAVYEAAGLITFEGAVDDGTRTVSLEAKDLAGNRGIKTWTFYSDSTKPAASNWAPARDGKVPVSTPEISVYITDASDNLDSSNLTAKIDGNTAAATLNLKGHWAYDSCSGSYWVVDSLREGKVVLTSPPMSDGIHEAEVKIADSRGNLLTEKWSFTIAAPPSFTVSPAAGSIQNNPVISAAITDNSGVNWNSVVLRVNNNVVTPNIDREAGKITYSGACPNGTVNVSIEARDIAGNVGSKTWSFTNAVSGPQFRTCYYRLDNSGRAGTVWELTDGFNITNGTLCFDGNIDDVVKITSVTAVLDGIPLSIESTPPTYYDGEREDWLNSDLRHVWYKYNGVVKDGDHTLVVTAVNEAGVSKSLTRTFTVRTPPVITGMSPLQYGITDLTPLISAGLKDPNGTILPESVVLMVDGVPVDSNYDANVNKVTYQSGQLSDESYHTITLTASDDSGFTATQTWKFYTNAKGYPDMADSNVGNCTTCHPGYTTLASHPISLYDGHGHNYTGCNLCHNYISVPAGCEACHDNGHGSTTSISYNATNYDLNFPLRIKSNREMYDCVLCHQPGSKVLGHYPGIAPATKPLKNHDIPEIHKYTDQNCNKCHAQSLTKEHARPGRVDQDGKALTCNSCHLSKNPDVLNAIANNNKNCNACHPDSDHKELHIWDGFNASCLECHQDSLVNEHLNNQKTTSGKNYDCDSCHGSNETAVRNAIKNEILSCSACHKTGHNLQLADSPPPDVSKYPGFQWAAPQNASVFLGDMDLADKYQGGKVLLSNRKAGVTLEEIWNYYNESSDTGMPSKGWTLNSSAFVPGAAGFAAEYTKDDRFVTVECLGSDTEQGPASDTGYRIRIWYQ